MLDSLSRQMKKSHWFLSVVCCVMKVLQDVSFGCSVIVLHEFGSQDYTSLKNRRAHVRWRFPPDGLSSTAAVWFACKHRHESKTQPAAVTAVGKQEQKYFFFVPLLPLSLHAYTHFISSTSPRPFVCQSLSQHLGLSLYLSPPFPFRWI